MGRAWRIQAGSEAQVFRVGVFTPDASALAASRAAVAKLLASRPGPAVARTLAEIHNVLQAGTPGVVAGGGPLWERRVGWALQAAAANGRLVVTRERALPAGVPTPKLAPVQPAAKPKKPTWFSLTVLDEVGRAVPGVKVAFDAAGDRLVVPTSGAGEARLDDIEGASTVGASLVSVEQALGVLAPRWQTPRAPNVPTGNQVFVRPAREATDTLNVLGATPAKLVLTPFLECREIPGAHFEFGRSFVRSGALELLAGIAEELAGDTTLKAMIFGHTDKAGGEALNKELSERRAKALYALFTQDSGAWEELFSGTADGPNWKEKWDVEEAQHMLNALGVTDDAGNALDEDGIRGPSTIQAIHRFQSGDYPDRPAEQAPLAQSDYLGVAGRKELFLAYAKRVSRTPVDKGRFLPIGGLPFMGCGEYNPLSVSVTDAESRRAVVFLLDPAAGPPNAPCKLRSTGPCKSNCGPAPTAPNADGSPPYRCKVYQAVAKKCPCQGGADLSHDLVVRVAFPLEVVDDFQHVLVVESDDGTIQQSVTLKSEARAVDSDECEVCFPHLPETHQYRLRVEGVDEPYEVFPFTPFDELSDLSVDILSADDGDVPPPPDVALEPEPKDGDASADDGSTGAADDGSDDAPAASPTN